MKSNTAQYQLNLPSKPKQYIVTRAIIFLVNSIPFFNRNFVERITPESELSFRTPSRYNFLKAIKLYDFYPGKLPIKIHIAEIQNSEELSSIAQKCFPKDNFDEENLIELIYKSQVYIANNLDNSIVGFSIIKDNYISFVGVCDTSRRKGVATSLLKRILEDNNQQIIYLHTETENEISQALYNSLGFHRKEKIKDFYSSPREDAYLYFKEPK